MYHQVDSWWAVVDIQMISKLQILGRNREEFAFCKRIFSDSIVPVVNVLAKHLQLSLPAGFYAGVLPCRGDQ